MGVIKQGGMVTTTRGMQPRKAPECWTCHERRDGQIYGIDPNGAPICATCSGDVPEETHDGSRVEVLPEA